MREKLAAACGPVYWSDLRAHATRGAIVIVSEGLDLLDVAEAVAKDEAERVRAWIEDGRLTKPSLDDLASWSRETEALWDAIVVAPYVLVRTRSGARAPSASSPLN
jgi:hypothetical protein